MILRSLQIENWRCIRELKLPELPGGIVVLHGPNGTGKSSLVLALRCCLFDSDHDSSSKELKSSMSWGVSTPPKVIVEFQAGSDLYRLTKVFSKKKEGTACLEKQVGGMWRIELDAPKEASRRTRELLGADHSSSGLNQLLWLTQGETKLPLEKGLDGTLEKRLVSVLGVMVTGRDLAFKDSLEGRYARWFTPSGKFKEVSSVREWEKAANERRTTRDSERQKLNHWENAIRQLHAAQDERPQRARALEQAQSEIKILELEAKGAKERVARYDHAASALEMAGLKVTQANDAMAKYRQALARNQHAQQERTKAASDVEAKKIHMEARNVDLQEATQLLEHARFAERDHAKTRDEIDDLRNLVTFEQRRAHLQTNLEQLTAKEKEIADLEKRLQEVLAPDEKALKDLRDNRSRVGVLRPKIHATGLTLTVAMEKPTKIDVAVDGEPARHRELEPGVSASWTIRQRAHLNLPGVGTIGLARGESNDDLEQAAAELTRLDLAYEEAVRAFRQDPDDENCLDVLVAALLNRTAWSKSLKSLREERDKLAPEGSGVVQAECGRISEKIRLVLQRRPSSAGWKPSAAEVESRQSDFKRNQAELETVRMNAEARAKTAQANLTSVHNELSALKERLATAEGAATVCFDDLRRQGEEGTLKAGVDQAIEAETAASAALRANQLSEADRTVEQRLADALTAVDTRAGRVRELDDRLLELRTQLLGHEGLHMRLNDAEAALQEAESALRRENLEAAAHKKLRDLFEECRENQVQQVMGPIAGRVLDWSRRIGLNNYSEVRFGDKFLPEGIVHEARGAGEPILFDDESYGTGEQLSLLVRLALGGVLAKDEPVVAILDDPLAHADPARHRNILNILRLASEGSAAWNPPAGQVQIIILTCHPDRFDHLPGACHINLEQAIRK